MPDLSHPLCAGILEPHTKVLVSSLTGPSPSLLYPKCLILSMRVLWLLCPNRWVGEIIISSKTFIFFIVIARLILIDSIFLINIFKQGFPVVAQWLRLHGWSSCSDPASTEGATGSAPYKGIKIPHATRCGEKKKKTNVRSRFVHSILSQSYLIALSLT